MPKSRVNGASAIDDSPVKEELVTPSTTPRRSKRKLDSSPLDSPIPSKLPKTEANGKAKPAVAKASVKAPASEAASTKRTPTKKRAQTVVDKVKEEVEKVEEELHDIVDNKEKGRGRSNGKKSKKEDSELEDSDIDLEQVDVKAEKKPKQKRRTKEEKEAEMFKPLAARTAGVRKLVGAHVSMAGGLENSVKNSLRIGGNAFALFLRSQKKWENPPLKDETRDAFKALAKEHNYDTLKYTLPHGSYLVNLAVEDADKAKQSYDVFVDDLHRCEALGIGLYNFHPGHYNTSTLSEGINRIAQQLNRALSATKTVIPVLENAAGSGTVIGSSFSDLRDIIAGIAPEHKHRIGVCIDTCHAFAAGYDLRTPDAFKAVLEDFDKTVGMQYLKALHINDSKAPFDSKKDLHQNIGLGFLGLRTFHNVMNDPRLEDMPLVLETPCDIPDPSDPTGKKTIGSHSVWTREIKLLESLIGMDPEGKEFKALESELSEKGRKERESMAESMRKTAEKKSAKAQKALEKGQKNLKDMFGGGTAKGKGKKQTKKEESSDLTDMSDDE